MGEREGVDKFLPEAICGKWLPYFYVNSLTKCVQELPEDDGGPVAMRYLVLDKEVQGENMTDRTPVKLDAVLTPKFLDPLTKDTFTYAELGASLELKNKLKSDERKARRTLARGGMAGLSARPRNFTWGISIGNHMSQNALTKSFSWVFCTRAGRFESEPYDLEPNFEDLVQTLASFATADESQLGFLDAFDHPPKARFSWEQPDVPNLPSISLPSNPTGTRSSSRLRAIAVSVSSASAVSSPAVTHGFKLDEIGKLRHWKKVGSDFIPNVVHKKLFAANKIAGKGTQVWLAKLLGEADGHLGTVNFLWLPDPFLERMKAHIQLFDCWRQESLTRQKEHPIENWDWLDDAPFSIFYRDDYSVAQLASEYATWTASPSPFVTQDRKPVLVFHKTTGQPLRAGPTARVVLKSLISVVQQIATMSLKSFVHRDISYDNMYSRNDQSQPSGFAKDYEQAKVRGKTYAFGNKSAGELTGTFPFLSRCVLTAYLVKHATHPPPDPKNIYQNYAQKTLDDLESVFYCGVYFFCHFVPKDKNNPLGELRTRLWPGSVPSLAMSSTSKSNLITPASEVSGQLTSGTSGSSASRKRHARDSKQRQETIFDLPVLQYETPYPLAQWFSAGPASLDKLALLGRTKFLPGEESDFETLKREMTDCQHREEELKKECDILTKAGKYRELAEQQRELVQLLERKATLEGMQAGMQARMQAVMQARLEAKRTFRNTIGQRLGKDHNWTWDSDTIDDILWKLSEPISFPANEMDDGWDSVLSGEDHARQVMDIASEMVAALEAGLDSLDELCKASQGS
ncbi:hypothetical protein BT69DRAFT_1278584 [Atractiella rhizophila]|nr:hypothetical protein BT69DRAFT_1278584 [Atractiella rhizophila]